jgi:hypothetical protein
VIETEEKRGREKDTKKERKGDGVGDRKLRHTEGEKC